MSGRVLIVDDELHILKAAEFKFKRQGLEVDCAYDGVQAWEMIQQNPPDMLVTDLQMPRMNGLTLIQQLRDDERFRDIPIILLTAKGYELDRDDIVNRLDVLEIFSKPFSPRDLCNRVIEALAHREDKSQQAEFSAGARPDDFGIDQTGEEIPSAAALNGADDTT